MTPIDNHLPAKIARLSELAYNLWWSWNPEARELFRDLDLPLWRTTQHNPVQMLQQMGRDELEDAASDSLFYSRYRQAILAFDREMNNGQTWFRQQYPQANGFLTAYFSAEFGLHSSLPIYSGGLGILSGDHAKEASDLGIPLVGVGFMYPQGYFRQRVPSHGWQEAVYEQLNMGSAPVMPVMDDDQQEKHVSVQIGSRTTSARIWHVRVGRVPLYLLDTDVDENEPWDRELSARLYSGDIEHRIRQEFMLGIGGVRALRALGIEPSVWHMNEGHSAFLILECIREMVSQGMSFEDARERAARRSLFTTHTPVPAGHDSFPFHMVEQYFSGFWDEIGISRQEFLDLGRHEETWGTSFNMTVLALRLSGQANGVSKLHGEVSRSMWQSVWPDRDPADIPITHVTNGIHVPTWTPTEMNQLWRKYLGPDWMEKHDDPALWERISDVPGRELWEMHLDLKRKMISYFQELARKRWVNGTSDPTQVMTSGTFLQPEALTIGFARRFATYKRALLIFRDVERLLGLALDIHRPVQFVFAGKAHPEDDPGKQLIQNIYNLAKNHRFGGRIAFIEDYDMHMARYLVQGVDVWLNTPRRPREASGTSGQKATLNGVPNLSVLDGWWVEGYNGANGWAFGGGNDLSDHEAQDARDAEALYQLLEDEIIPLYYARDRDDVPRGWVGIMREAIRSNAPRFSSRRMLKEYTSLYIRAYES
ncbi:MAG: alpha-glucan family phosphorylase [Chloroflexota bacterium]|jgi:starch phosphorylase